MYKIGQRISTIDRNNASGTINDIIKVGPATYFDIMLDSGDSIQTHEGNIRPLMKINTPLDLFAQANFQTKEIFSVTTALNKIMSNSTDIIASLKSSRTDFLPFQFKPLLKFLKSDSRRILIADEVGLGKTIEAGYILAEMSLREQVNNCLIICKSTLKDNWKAELKAKFGFDFEIYKIRELKKALEKENGNNIFGIINLDYSFKVSEDFLEFIHDLQIQFDMLIIDEAHILRNASTVRHNVAEELIRISKSCILMTATPVMTSLENLYNIVKIIEPNYNDYEKISKSNTDFGYGLFMDHVTLSRPFINANNRLSQGHNPSEIINDLINESLNLSIHIKSGLSNFPIVSTTVGNRFANDPLFIAAKNLGLKRHIGLDDKAQLQYYFTELNSFNSVINRTRRRDVQKEIKSNVTRIVQKIPISFSDGERMLYDNIIDDYEGNPLALTTKKRQATSCLPAYLEKNNSGFNIPDFSPMPDSKFDAFMQIINEVVIRDKNKIIVFSFFKDTTLPYLEKRLVLKGISTIKLDGSTPIRDRQKYVDEFRKSTHLKVLLVSEVGSEGLNMQFCDAMVNYDLPWNPMILEQRIGRIDRIGQKSPTISIYNLCIRGSIEEQIYERLLSRIQVFTQTIGGLEDILDTNENIFEKDDRQGLEVKLYGHRLTETQRKKIYEQTEQAIENVKRDKVLIVKDLDNSFLNDMYISNEINVINKQKKYFSDTDASAILKLLFQKKLATIKTVIDSNKPYIKLENNANAFFEFIKTNLPDKRIAPNIYSSYLDFWRRCANKTQIDLTFNQEEAYENNSLEYITSSHPIIQSALNHFKREGIAQNNAYAFGIRREDISISTDLGIFFILAKYQMKTIKKTIGKVYESIAELPLLFNISEEGFTLLEDNNAATLLELDFAYWFQHPNPPDHDECLRILKTLKPVMFDALHKKKNEIQQNQNNVFVSRQFRLIDTEVEFLKRQIEKEKSIINIETISKKRIEEYNNKLQILSNQKQEIGLIINETLQSISLIEII